MLSMDAMVQLDRRGGASESPATGDAPRWSRGTSTSTTARSTRLKDVSVDIPERSVTAFIGPSGCGKSTFLRCINRMNDTIPIARVTGKIEIDGRDIYDQSLDVVQLRARVGMVFQKPNPFPEVDLRERRLRAAHPRSCHARRPNSTRSSMTSLKTRRPVGRGEGSPGRFRHRPVRRSAAASVHRARHRGRPRSHPDGRAVLGARSDRDRAASRS